MKSTNHVRTPVLLSLLLSFLASSATAACAGESGTRHLGEELGRAMVREAMALARTGSRSVVDCDELDEDAIPEYHPCAEAETLAELAFRVEALREKPPAPGSQGAYEGSLDETVFAVLLKGLDSADTLVRWHVLGKIFLYCDYPELLSPLGRTECRREVEVASLKILSEDPDPLNRMLALEILAEGYASERSAGTLERLLADRGEVASVCPRILEGNAEAGLDELNLDALEGLYKERRPWCEGLLAEKALKMLK